MRVDDIYYWVKERHTIFLKKEAGEPKPWTQDKIMQQYRFCNPYRENDKVTIWIKDNWRDPHSGNPDLWFAMVVSRLINLPECMEEIGFPVPWDREKFLEVMHRRQRKFMNTFNSAYIVSTNGKSMNKADYLADYVLAPMWADRAKLRPRAGDTLESFAKRLNDCIGMGTFMTGQVVADIKYVEAPVGLLGAKDWWTWATPGPGSKRGLNRVIGRDKDTPWGKDWLPTLHALQKELNKRLEQDSFPMLHAQDVQNCNCEFDKLERVRNGEGRPKSVYPGAR